MRSIPKSFYDSPAWKACRATYLQQHPLCEDCLMRGIYKPAAHVHHLVWLDEGNYLDASVSLNHDNLRAVCVDCHNREHAAKAPRRWKVDAAGNVTPLV